MDTLLKADIFFFVSAIAIMAFGAVFVIAAVYVIKILRDIQHITKQFKQESNFIIEDVEDLRNFLKKEGKKVSLLGEWGGMLLHKWFSRRKRLRKKNLP